MVQQGQPLSVVVTLVMLVDRIPLPPPPAARRRGRPRVYPDRLFLKALVIMVLKRLPKVHSLLAVLEQDTPEMASLRTLLTIDGRYPSRRTFERRLRAIPETLPAQIACLGQHLVELLKPWTEGEHESSRAGAIDSTVLPANGGVWHKKHREAGIVPHTSIDTEAGWTRSGWHGFVYGWKLHLVVTAATIARVWIPLAATLTPANVADNVEAPRLLDVLAEILRFLLGDVAYNTEDLHKTCAAKQQVLVTTKRGKYPHTDEGVEVRRVFHQLRSQAIENFNGQFKAIFDCRRPVPTRGFLATSRFVLGAVLVYQLTLLHRFENHQDLRVGLKPLLQAA
jgi:Transposase DDE domain